MSKRKQTIIRAAIVIGVLLILSVIIYAIVNWVLTNRVEERIASLKAEGQPVTIADVSSKAASPDDDAAAILQEVSEDIETVALALAPFWDADRPPWGHLNDADRETIRAVFDAHPDLIPTLERAARASEYRVVIPSTRPPLAVLPHVQFLRSIGRILSTRAMLFHADGKPDEALDTCVTLLQLCRHFDQEPALISHLVAIACRSIAVEAANAILRGEGVSQAARANLEAELARHDMPAAYRDALVEERAVGIASFRQHLDRIGYLPVRVIFLNDMSDYLDLMGRQIETAQAPYHVAVKQLIDTKDLGLLTSLSVPPLGQTREATARSIAKLRCLRILNAMASRSDVAEDASLDELDLPAEVLTDPFTGDPLLLKQTEEGWIVYSVGADGKDDGGDLRKVRDVGVAPVSDFER